MNEPTDPAPRSSATPGIAVPPADHAGPEPAAGPVVAVAGRRIDAPGTAPRFPLAAAPNVGRRIAEFLTDRGAAGVVASAACGADLLALEAAAALGLPHRIVLPFDRRRFRESSVVDRPGDWGARFDRVLERAAGSVIVLNGTEGNAAYSAANDAILDEATALARAGQPDRPRPLVALLVWEGAPRDGNDITAEFAEKARARGFELVEITTL